VDYQENEDDPTGPYHVLRQEGCFGLIINCIPHRARHPVLHLKNDAQDNMKNEAGKQHDLEDLHYVVGPHESGRVVKPPSAVMAEQAKVNTQMDHKEYYKKQPQ